MADFMYTSAIDKLGTAAIDLTSAVIKVQPVATGSGNYQASQSGDTSLADIPAGARIGTAATLSGATFSGGVFDAADLSVVNSAVAQVGAAVLYVEDAGSPTSESLSWLLCYLDSATGLPYDAAGDDIAIAWSDATNKIFKIG